MALCLCLFLKGSSEASLLQFTRANAPQTTHKTLHTQQSGAILRHLGRRYGLYGDGGLRQAADIDAVVDGAADLRAKLWVSSCCLFFVRGEC